ncbi:MAG TPA: hypothetical protein VG871_01210 [Vicinamibacterales bacterium]|nr:hypothetical protein [Vicinamibacterales bacterium]
MTRSRLIRALGAVTCAAVALASCSSPPPAAPSATQVAGAWQAFSALTAVSGGECVGADLQNAIGRRDVFLVALAGESTMDATITSQGNGTSCEYTGVNAAGQLTLTMGTCQISRVLNVACSSGVRRDMQIVGGSLQGTASAQLGSGTGSSVETWNVLAAGSSQPIASLNLTSTFNWTYLGLPASNYHVATGTVFPGYADGTISIPADPNPWCLPCGWFH